MVKLFIFLLLKFGLANNYTIKMSCFPKTIYRGEKTVCDFMLYSKSTSRVRAEVIKFPQFRGFWSKNIMLRQGDLELVGSLDGENIFKIGSYSLIPTINDTEFLVIGLKLAVRDAYNNKEDFMSIETEPYNLIIKDLPKPPSGVHTELVGKLNFRALNEVLHFTPNQPVSIRYLLEGSGNFREEMSKLDLPEVSNLKVLSSKVVNYGENSKMFEYICEVTENTVIPPLVLNYFNPETEKYDKISTKEVKLIKRIVQKIEKKDTIKELTPNISHTRLKNFLFYFLIVVFSLFLIYRFRKVIKFSTRNHKKSSIKPIWKKVKKAFLKKDERLFLKFSNELVRLINKEEKGAIKNTEIFENVFKEVLENHNRFFYGPNKIITFNLDELYKELEVIIKKYPQGKT